MIRALVLLTLLLSVPALAAPTQGFRAEYEVFIDGKAAGESVMELVPGENGSWQHRLSATGTRGLAKLARFTTEQVADIDWLDGRPRLLGAEMTQRSLVKDRDLKVRVDWDRGTIRWTGDIEKDEPAQRPIDGRPSVGSSLNLQLAYDARAAKPGKRVEYVLHDRGRRRALDYVAGAPETVQVPAGRFSAVPMRGERVEKQRVTIAWYDPALPPTPVRVLQTEEGEEKYELRLRRIESPASGR
ncbi:DUF3108 domain-containing protein [Pseudomarimonas salicorniae]|uniref:DUF3108 domain-containing protein n=1 Tax=Pseudomarimonas salicorniae TaxID=2933270 RepID=A0ABT0GGK8_9GAMM|nr:DUF3108 domain-containing protein [Lysobacter sp. CAU 1642]MCK7593673.1 DUF3108 domain-containing protein [Lysobacter sp. CAU 1642]